MKAKLSVLAGIIAVAVTAQATVITFDSANGYADGALAGQPSSGPFTWSGHLAWNVASGSAQITSADGNFQRVGWSQPFSASTITQSSSLVLTRTVEQPDNVLNHFFIGIDAGAANNQYAAVGLRQFATGLDSYALYFYENVGTESGQTSSGFSGATIGLTPGGVDATDLLRLDMTHIYNGGDSWTTIAVLYNEATAQTVATMSIRWSASGNAPWSDADKNLMMTSATIGSATGATVNFDQASINTNSE